MLMRYKDSPDPPPPGMVPPGLGEQGDARRMRVGETIVMASDGHVRERPAFRGFSLSLTVPTAADADRVFAALADGGKVQMPLGKTFWSPRFGMLDRPLRRGLDGQRAIVTGARDGACRPGGRASLIRRRATCRTCC